MPKKLEQAIKKTMRRKAAKGQKIKDTDAYLYGALRKTGRKPAAHKGGKRKK